MKGLLRGRAAFPSPPLPQITLCQVPPPQGFGSANEGYVNDLNFAEILPYCKGPSH